MSVALKVEEWPVGKLIEYARNPRKNDSEVDRMVSSIKEFGFRIPVIARSDGEVIDGHLRLKAAKKLGMETVPVALADELTPAQIKAFRLLANRSASWAAWDEELLRLELEDLKGLDFDLSLTGFGDDELAGLLDFAPDQLGGGTGTSTGTGSGAGSLAERFLVPPFSVLNAREGWWQDRKRAWIALGIQSELGRGENGNNAAPGGSPQPLDRMKNAKKAGEGGLTRGGSSRDYRKGSQLLPQSQQAG